MEESPARRSRSAPAASRHISTASISPCRPVQALAFPEFTTIPRNFPPRIRSRPILIGAANTLLVVNTAAAVAGTSQISSPTSGEGVDLIPE